VRSDSWGSPSTLVGRADPARAAAALPPLLLLNGSQGARTGLPVRDIVSWTSPSSSPGAPRTTEDARRGLPLAPRLRAQQRPLRSGRPTAAAGRMKCLERGEPRRPNLCPNQDVRLATGGSDSPRAFPTTCASRRDGYRSATGSTAAKPRRRRLLRHVGGIAGRRAVGPAASTYRRRPRTPRKGTCVVPVFPARSNNPLRAARHPRAGAHASVGVVVRPATGTSAGRGPRARDQCAPGRGARVRKRGFFGNVHDPSVGLGNERSDRPGRAHLPARAIRAPRRRSGGRCPTRRWTTLRRPAHAPSSFLWSDRGVGPNKL
jgi:hypothetical protein